MHYAALTEQIEARFGGLSPKLRQAARHLLRRPDDVALKSMRQLAADAGVQPATMVRLARALGFRAFEELRAPFADRLRHRAETPYGERARALQARSGSPGDGGTAAALVRESFERDVENLRLTYETIDADEFEACAARLAAARKVHVTGLRSAFAIAYFFDYACRMFGTSTELLDGRGGTLTDGLRGIGAHDAVLACTFEPYTRETVEVVRFAQTRGAAIIAITDNPLSPIARQAAHALVVGCESPSFFSSLVGAVSVVQLLVALLIARGGETALSTLAESEAQLRAFSAYWEEGGRA
jgi:DNA-binding MurR/RpiR family transcriptional regulator